MPPILLRSGRVSRRLLVLECTTSARPSYPSTTVSLPFASWSSWKSASHSLLNRSLSTTTRSALSVQTSRVNQHLRPPQTEPLLQMATKSYKVLIAGSCYAGLAAVVNLLDKVETINSPVSVEITLVDERGGFYHVIGSPLALSDKEFSKKAWVDFKDIAAVQRPNIRLIHGSLTKIDCATKTATITERGTTEPQTVEYDYFVAASGLRRPWPVVPQSLTRKEYLEEASKHIDIVTANTAPVVVVGGGAVGIEMAAELKVVRPELSVTLAHSRDKVLSAEPLPDKVKDCVYDAILRTGVDVLLNHRLKSQTPAKTESGADVYDVEFENGHKMKANAVIFAVSKPIPTSTYLPAETLNDEGYVNVLPTMQFKGDVPNAEYHFAAGDIINWSGIKRCGGAMHKGMIAAVNMHQLMLQEVEGKEPDFFKLNPIPPMIGIAVGKEAVAYGPEGMSHGTQTMHSYFEDDLGFRICWDHLRLGKARAEL